MPVILQVLWAIVGLVVGLGAIFYGFPYMIRQERRLRTVAESSKAMRQLIVKLDSMFNDIEGTVKDASREVKQVLAKVDGFIGENGGRPWHENLRGKIQEYLKEAQTDLERMVYKWIDKFLAEIWK